MEDLDFNALATIDMEPIEKKLKTYAKLKVLEKKVADLIEKIKPAIKGHLLEEGLDKLPTNVGVFSLVERTTWQYSKAVEELQKAEKANGTAKAVKAVTLMFKAEKENE